MKNIISVFGLALLCSSPAYAQYKMELDKVATPQLNYIKMGHPGAKGQEIRINNLYWEEAGKPKFPVMGEFHYNRMDERYWRESLMKMKASGIDIVSTYSLWVLHEEFEGRQDWSGRNNLRKFVELCKEIGLKVHLRPGPYCNAEIRNGGFPDWIEFNKNLKPRTNDPLYLEYVKYWYQSLFNQVKGLLYKDGGPIVAIQLENEYVTEGMVVPHLTALKKIAVEAGFDLPVYSMTHWMMSDYPKGEIIPYAGYYLETPWISFGDKENPTTDQEFFSYNRVSDNIGNDFIKTSAKVESLDASANDSPYFTCEMGLGAPNYYMRRAVVEEEMAGENINLRLGCGVNLMGYYMYVGQTDPIGEQYTTARATARVSNDYQAPIREFGQLGVVMKESKKLNYFMNDFGSELVSKRAFLPLANRDRKNLQWAVRTDGKSGYVFCSNILHKHPRKEYRNVQFNLELDGEKVCLPRKKTTIKDRSYFFWPFNMDLKGIVLNYATAQPICHLDENGTRHYFFFEDDGIPAEFRFKAENIAEVQRTSEEVERRLVRRWAAGRQGLPDPGNRQGRSTHLHHAAYRERVRLHLERRSKRKEIRWFERILPVFRQTRSVPGFGEPDPNVRTIHRRQVRDTDLPISRYPARSQGCSRSSDERSTMYPSGQRTMGETYFRRPQPGGHRTCLPAHAGRSGNESFHQRKGNHDYRLSGVPVCRCDKGLHRRNERDQFPDSRYVQRRDRRSGSHAGQRYPLAVEYRCTVAL